MGTHPDLLEVGAGGVEAGVIELLFFPSSHLAQGEVPHDLEEFGIFLAVAQVGVGLNDIVYVQVNSDEEPEYLEGGAADGGVEEGEWPRAWDTRDPQAREGGKEQGSEKYNLAASKTRTYTFLRCNKSLQRYF